MKKALIMILAVLVIFVFCVNAAGAKKDPKTIEEKFAYTIGGMIYEYYGTYYDINEKNVDFFVRGVKDKISGKYLYDNETDSLIFSEYSDTVLNKVSKENLAKAEAFLKDNAKKAGVVCTSSGLQYKVEKEGTGKKPAKDSTVSTFYKLSDMEGNVIQVVDSSNGPVSFGVNQLVPGVSEGLCLMSEGSVYTFYLHPDLGYGPNGSGQIEPNQLLVFEFELVAVE